MSLHFTDEEFLEAWKELDKPQLEGGWEFFTETMGVKIYRLYDKVHLSYCFETGIESENCCVSLSAVSVVSWRSNSLFIVIMPIGVIE